MVQPSALSLTAHQHYSSSGDITPMSSKQHYDVLVMMGKDDKNRLLKNQAFCPEGDANSLWHVPVSNRSFYFEERQSNKKQLYHNAASPDFLAKAHTSLYQALGVP